MIRCTVESLKPIATLFKVIMNQEQSCIGSAIQLHSFYVQTVFLVRKLMCFSIWFLRWWVLKQYKTTDIPRLLRATCHPDINKAGQWKCFVPSPQRSSTDPFFYLNWLVFAFLMTTCIFEAGHESVLSVQIKR